LLGGSRAGHAAGAQLLNTSARTPFAPAWAVGHNQSRQSHSRRAGLSSRRLWSCSRAVFRRAIRRSPSSAQILAANLAWEAVRIRCCPFSTLRPARRQGQAADQHPRIGGHCIQPASGMARLMDGDRRSAPGRLAAQQQCPGTKPHPINGDRHQWHAPQGINQGEIPAVANTERCHAWPRRCSAERGDGGHRRDAGCPWRTPVCPGNSVIWGAPQGRGSPPARMKSACADRAWVGSSPW